MFFVTFDFQPHIVYQLTQFKGTIALGLLVLIGFNGLYSIVAGILVAIEVNRIL